jgi:site-specific recombinase XerD
MMGCIEKLLGDGVSAISVNTYLRGLKAYCRWLHAEGHLPELFKITFLKTETKILTVLSQAQIDKLLAYKPVGATATRTHVAALLMLDCGLRISEVTGLRYDRVNWDQLVLEVRGKGNKWRAIPFSEPMRRILYRYTKGHQNGLVFGTRNGTRVSVRNFERDLAELCKRLQISGCSPHALRRTFACAYLKRGGNLEFLRRILGHQSISTTQKYVEGLDVEDLGAVHSDLSPLSGRKGAPGNRKP